MDILGGMFHAALTPATRCLTLTQGERIPTIRYGVLLPLPDNCPCVAYPAATWPDTSMSKLSDDKPRRRLQTEARTPST
eukprot:4496768-Lingulodinium_polyedra.AAC.1